MDGNDLRALLACPACRGALGWSAEETRCEACGRVYPVVDGIPILLPPDLDAAAVHDELDHLRAHKGQQAGYFDRQVAEEFEINRPHGAPRAYAWVLGEKFRRSVALLPPLRGKTVVDACCGSGMDAEFLTREGARVLAIDLSEGCARRAKARAGRFGLEYFVVVGDVEHLPVRTAAADVSYVHDGLHHLEDPLAGVRELARVAACAVSINEPADAAGTQLAVRLGVSTNREDAGNRVARLRPERVREELRTLGFSARTRRYLLYYKHEPGPLMRVASRPVGDVAYRSAVRLTDAVLGRWGNKLQVTAVRRR
ncbi:MAG: methyltransferase domain-containing protein [Chloroflexota bacterium]|nr:methyltransferase domain-containing protein [Chloroflexota bacterium]